MVSSWTHERAPAQRVQVPHVTSLVSVAANEHLVAVVCALAHPANGFAIRCKYEDGVEAVIMQ